MPQKHHIKLDDSDGTLLLDFIMKAGQEVVTITLSFLRRVSLPRSAASAIAYYEYVI